MAASTFTDKEKDALKVFREKIHDVIPKMDQSESLDVNLIRWLRARELNIQDAEEMLRNSMKWREENNIAELTKDQVWDEYLLKNMLTKPGGKDKDGTWVIVCPFGRWDLKGMIHDGYRDKMFRHIFKFLENINSIPRVAADVENVQTQLVLVFDYDQFSMRQVLSPKAVGWVIDFFRMFDANYPERMKTAFVVNVPKIFEMFWPMINKVLSPRTLSKVRVLGGNPGQWRAKLRESIDGYELPSDMGGSNTTQHFFANRFGLSIFSLPRAPMYPAEDFSTIEVSAGKKFTPSFDLVVGNRITWNFRTNENDIGFEVTLKGERMFPYAKVDSHMCVQDGLVDVIEDGKYTLVFDNSYSRYTAKTLLYVIYVDGKKVS